MLRIIFFVALLILAGLFALSVWYVTHEVKTYE